MKCKTTVWKTINANIWWKNSVEIKDEKMTRNKKARK